MAVTHKTSQQRISALLRVIALVCIIIGALFAYFTYQGLATFPFPQIQAVFYFISVLLIFVGVVVLIARYE